MNEQAHPSATDAELLARVPDRDRAATDDELLARAGEIRDAILAENIKRDQRITSNNRSIRNTRIVGAIVVALVTIVAVIGVGVGISGRSDAHAASSAARHAQIEAARAATALARYKEQQADARKVACDQSNHARDIEVAAQKKQIRALLTLAITASVRPGQDPTSAQRFLNAVLPGYDKTVEDGHPRRDCTPAGIAAYLHQVAPS